MGRTGTACKTPAAKSSQTTTAKTPQNVKSPSNAPAPASSNVSSSSAGLSAQQFKLITDQIDFAVNRAFADMDARLALALQSPAIQPAIASAVHTAVTNAISKAMEPLQEKIATMERKIAKLEHDQDDLEQYGRRWNLLLHGIPETDQENCENKVRELCEQKLKVNVSAGAIQRAHRLGSKKTERSRPIIVRFTDYKMKQHIYKQKRHLKGTGLLITENLTPPRQALYKQVRECKSVSASWTNDGNIFVLHNSK